MCGERLFRGAPLHAVLPFQLSGDCPCTTGPPFVLPAEAVVYTERYVRLLLLWGIVMEGTSERQSVTIYRDLFGVPHIYADTDEAAMYAHGYAMAEDCVQQVLRNIMTAEGRMAEVGGDEFVESDFWARQWMAQIDLESEMKAVPSDVARLTICFAKGVNALITERQTDLPDWVEPIDLRRVFEFSCWLPLWWSFGMSAEAKRPSSQESVKEMPAGSSAWIVGRSRTADGNTIGMIDPHLAWEGLWCLHEAHIHGKTINVFGYFIAGLPFPVFGHNDHIFWTETMGSSDICNTYVEKVHPDDPERYLFEREWLFMTVSDIAVKVRTNSGFETRRKRVAFTRHGPVVRRDSQYAYVVRSPMVRECRFLEQLYGMVRANTVRTWRGALRPLALPNCNMFCADRDGNMLYILHARAPLRSTSHKQPGEIPGWTRESDWHGFVTVEDLPQIYNPASEIIQNCNEPLDPVAVVGGKAANPLSSAQTDSRATWHERLFDRERLLILEDAMSIATDLSIIGAELRIDAYERAWSLFAQEMVDKAAIVGEALHLLREWDKTAGLNSIGAALYLIAGYEYSLMQDNIADPFTVPITPIQDTEQLRQLLESLTKAAETLRSKHGSLRVPLRKVQCMKRGTATWPVAGGSFFNLGLACVRNVNFGPLREDGTFLAESGQIATTIVILGEKVISYAQRPFGQSQSPESRHYTDQAPLFRDRRFRPTWYQKEDLLAHVESAVEIEFAERAIEFV